MTTKKKPKPIRRRGPNLRGPAKLKVLKKIADWTKRGFTQKYISKKTGYGAGTVFRLIKESKNGHLEYLEKEFLPLRRKYNRKNGVIKNPEFAFSELQTVKIQNQLLKEILILNKDVLVLPEGMSIDA